MFLYCIRVSDLNFCDNDGSINDDNDDNEDDDDDD